MFNYQRKSVTGYSVPSWLSEPRLRLNFQKQTHNMLISSIYPNGRQSTVSLRHLPLIERKDNFNSQNFNNTFERQLETPIIEDQPLNQIITSNEQVDIENDRALDKEASESTNLDVEQNISLQHSTWIQKPLVKL